MYKYIGYAFLFTCLLSCATKTSAGMCGRHTAESITASDAASKCASDNELINYIYDKFVFAIDTDANDNPEDYFTSNALKKLRQDYDFDCEDGPCYAYYALRTREQDAKPDSEDVSQIRKIESVGDGWYVVSYLDMGWSGKTRVKMVDGKIDDYERCVSDL